MLCTSNIFFIFFFKIHSIAPAAIIIIRFLINMQSFSFSFFHISLDLPTPLPTTRLPSICISHAVLTAPLEHSTCPNQQSLFSLKIRLTTCKHIKIDVNLLTSGFTFLRTYLTSLQLVFGTVWRQ